MSRAQFAYREVYTQMEEAQPNPFNIPGDEDIFRHREEEKTRKLETRMAALTAPVSDKSTFASRMQSTTTEEVRDLLQKLRPPQGSTLGKTGKLGALTAAATAGVNERRKEKENMSDFIGEET